MCVLRKWLGYSFAEANIWNTYVVQYRARRGPAMDIQLVDIWLCHGQIVACVPATKSGPPLDHNSFIIPHNSHHLSNGKFCVI